MPTKTAAYSQVCAAGSCSHNSTSEVCAGMQPPNLPRQDTPTARGALLQLCEKDGQALFSPMSQMYQAGFAEHGGLRREAAGPWKRQLVVVPLSKTAGYWLRA